MLKNVKIIVVEEYASFLKNYSFVVYMCGGGVPSTALVLVPLLQYMHNYLIHIRPLFHCISVYHKT